MVVHTGPGLVGLAWRWEIVTFRKRVRLSASDHATASRTGSIASASNACPIPGTSTSWRGSGVASNSSSASRAAMKGSSLPCTYVTGVCRFVTSAIGGRGFVHARRDAHADET